MSRIPLVSTELFDLFEYNRSLNKDAVIYVTSRNFDGGAQNVFAGLSRDVSFYELRVDNWDDNLTPWKADPKMKGRIFGGEAGKLLAAVISDVLPVVKKDSSNVYIAGYSLAGLFSLWSLYECDFFTGCACCSGSLWYPGWSEYIREHEIKSDKVYLSIGNREKNSKNEYMKQVEEVYLLQQELLKDKNIHFDLNEGGHFNDVNNRVIKGINWLIEGK